ncbi:LacI family DNA-binding transcriptional regulator [Propionibacteriaceae bacterium G57]|uniref:LacI family DNA-binding transcriptional regulator n=1 Tax=Aestuariimicrobium sp. G57 TaxID=3418485 RepID=UPI003DA6ED63
MPQPRGVTIRDVAQLAGVSKSLVSLVLRGDPRVSEERRAAVLTAMAELDYRPNHAARSLSTARSGVVGILIEDLRNPWFVDLLEGLTSTLRAAELTPVLTDATTVRAAGGDAVASLTALGVDGIVVVGSTDEEEPLRAAATTTPIVLAGTRRPHLPFADIAADNDTGGGRQATEHLIGLGHQRIAHLMGPGEVGQARLTGYREALVEAGLSDRELVVTSGASEDGGYTATRELLALADRPTAIFAYNDAAAIGALSAADDLGIAVPDELSVVGFDNTRLARIRRISLTSVDNGNYAVGVRAGEFLADRIASPQAQARQFEGPTSLVVRGTSGRVPHV